MWPGPTFFIKLPFPEEFQVLSWEQDCCKRANALFLTFPGQPQLQFAQLAASPTWPASPNSSLPSWPLPPFRAFSAVLGWDCLTSKRLPSTLISESHHSSRSPLGEVGLFISNILLWDGKICFERMKLTPESLPETNFEARTNRFE